MVDFQQQPHGGRQRDALVAGQRQHLVVIHHCVHALQQQLLVRPVFAVMHISVVNQAHLLPTLVHLIHAHLYPLSINVSIQQDPLVLIDLVVGHFSESGADESLPPLPC